MKHIKKQNLIGALIITLLIFLIIAIQFKTERITDKEGFFTIPQNEFRIPIPDTWKVHMDEQEQGQTDIPVQTFRAMEFYTGNRLAPDSVTAFVICGQYRTQDLILQNPLIKSVRETVIQQGEIEYAIAITELSPTQEHSTKAVLSFRPVDLPATSELSCELTGEDSVIQSIYSQLTNNL